MNTVYDPKDIKIVAITEEGEYIHLDGFDKDLVFSYDYVDLGIIVQNIKAHDKLVIGKQYNLEVVFSGMEVGMKSKLLTLTGFYINTDITTDFYIRYTFKS